MGGIGIMEFLGLERELPGWTDCRACVFKVGKISVA